MKENFHACFPTALLYFHAHNSFKGDEVEFIAKISDILTRSAEVTMSFVTYKSILEMR